jgi:hypothetical protein
MMKMKIMGALASIIPLLASTSTLAENPAQIQRLLDT